LYFRDQEDGFDPNSVSNPLAVKDLGAEHVRSIHLMKLAVDEVSERREIKGPDSKDIIGESP